MIKSTCSVYDKLMVYAGCMVLLVLALVLYKERVTYSDSAAYIVHIMSRNTFEISMHSRYIGALTQVLPLAAFRCHAPLSIILMLYSLNSMLIPVCCALVSMYWFRETRTAWSILLFMTIMATWMFYYPVSEYQSGLCLLLFYTGAFNYFLSRERVHSLSFILLSLLLLPTFIFSHPLAMPVFACWVLLRLFIERSSWRQLCIPVLIAIVSYGIKTIFFSIEYEDKRAEALEHFRQFSVHDLIKQLGKDFLKIVFQDYFLLVLAGIGILLLLFLRRRSRAAISFSLAMVGWWMLVTVSFRDAHYDHYYEHMYQAIPFFVALYSCNLVIPALKPGAGRILLTCVFIISVAKVCSAAKFHQDRFAWFERCFGLMNELHCKKAAFNIMSIPGGMTCPSIWSVPYETLLLSSIQDKQQGKSILISSSLEQVKKEPRQVYDIDTIDNFPLTPHAYFDINGYPWCIPEDQYTPEQINKIMYGNISD